MNWIKDVLPLKDDESDSLSVSVIVTDGEKWGHGVYNYTGGYWVVYFVGQNESDSTSVIAWCYPPSIKEALDKSI